MLSVFGATCLLLGSASAYVAPRTKNPGVTETIGGILLLTGLGIVGFLLGTVFGPPQGS
jgi:hypothetical protein